MTDGSLPRLTAEADACVAAAAVNVDAARRRSAKLNGSAVLSSRRMLRRRRNDIHACGRVRGGWGGGNTPLPDGQIRPPRRPEGVQGDGSPLPDGQIRPPRRPEGVQGDGSPLPDGQIRPPRRPEGVQGDGSPLPDGQIRPPRRPEGVQGDGSPLPDGQIRPPRRPEGARRHGYCDFDSRPFDSHFPDQPQKRLVSAPPTRDGPPPASRELRLARTGLTALLTPAGSWAIV